MLIIVIFYPSATSKTIISINPIATPIVPKSEYFPFCDSGINSCITTYIIAPAANDSIYGRILIAIFVSIIVVIAPIGSTIPDKVPFTKALNLLSPAVFNGIEIIAPSGKFWIAIPTDNAVAPAIVMLILPANAPAKATPTAIPSGILWSVTARIIIVIFLILHFVFLRLTWKCGIIWLIRSSDIIPTKNPLAAGNHDGIFLFAISIDGINKDQTEAAIITPDANPKSIFSTFLFILFFIKKTHDEPKVVPKKGINIPISKFKSLIL